MHSNQKLLVAKTAGAMLTPISVWAGVLIGWQRFNYDFQHHPNWHIMNPEDGGFGQLGAVVTYCGGAASVGFVVGLLLSASVWSWANRRFKQPPSPAL